MVSCPVIGVLSAERSKPLLSATKQVRCLAMMMSAGVGAREPELPAMGGIRAFRGLLAGIALAADLVGCHDPDIRRQQA